MKTYEAAFSDGLTTATRSPQPDEVLPLGSPVRVVQQFL